MCVQIDTKNDTKILNLYYKCIYVTFLHLYVFIIKLLYFGNEVCRIVPMNIFQFELLGIKCVKNCRVLKGNSKRLLTLVYQKIVMSC